MTTTTIGANTSSSSLPVTNGNTFDVANGGTISNFSVMSGGFVLLSAGVTGSPTGGVDTGSYISSGGVELVLGSATGDTIAGTQNVGFSSSGGSASVSSGSVSNETIVNGGVVNMSIKGTTATNMTVDAGGTLTVNGFIDPTNTVVSGGLVILESAKAGIAGTFTFAGGGELQVTAITSAASGGSFFGDENVVISGFGSGGAIVDVNVATAAYNGGSVTTSGGNTVVTISGTSGTHSLTQTFLFSGTAISANLSVQSDQSGGEEIALLACYMPGTRIATPAGEAEIETLAIGDMVLTASGETKPIRWIGRRSYLARFIACNPDMLPVRIQAGALADGIPRRDLWVSPRHAMLIDGVLVQAGDLVNGATIAQVDQRQDVTYLHLELDRHDVLLAEGAPSESFLDDDSRAMFHNAAEYSALYPDDIRKPAMYCAPRISQGFALQAIRQRLDERAGLRDAKTDQPLRGFVDGIENGCIVGWAQNPQLPTLPVCLDILLDGKLLTQVLANQYRPDLKTARIGTGHQAFAARLPEGVGENETHRVVVRRTSDQAVLRHTDRLRHSA
jgi:hypothetical protein